METSKTDITPFVYIVLMIFMFLIGTSVKAQSLKKTFKFSTFYAAVNGGTSLSDVEVFSVGNGLSTQAQIKSYVD